MAFMAAEGGWADRADPDGDGAEGHFFMTLTTHSRI